MKRLFAALTLVLLCSVALAVSAANATHSNGEGPNKDLVSGTGTHRSGSNGHVDAISDPNGEDPRGHVFIRFSAGSLIPVDVTGEVTCLRVRDNRAWAVGTIERSKVDSSPFSHFAVFIADIGEGREANDRLFLAVADRPIFVPEFGEPCPQNLIELLEPFITGAPVLRGNFIVHDATP
jgi:hypothetical protein